LSWVDIENNYKQEKARYGLWPYLLKKKF
jgi:hypothetical protein